jgi:hypothetical protein
VNWTAEPPPADPEAIISAFQQHYEALSDRIGGLTDSGWQSKSQLMIEWNSLPGSPGRRLSLVHLL